MTSPNSGDKPKVAFTLEQIESEARPDVEPLRMGVGGKTIVIPSMMEMDANEFQNALTAMNSKDSVVGELGEAGAMMQLLPIMIGEKNYQVLVDAKASIGALILTFKKAEEYYQENLEDAGVDPKGSTSQSS